MIKTKDRISSKEIYALFGFNIRPQVSQLINDRKIFTKKQGKHSIYSLDPLQEEIIREKEFDIRSLKEGDKILRDLEIVKEIKESKKTDIAKKHNISVKTITHIEKRFHSHGAKGLIHTRKPKTLEISSTKEAAIIAETIQHPEKTAKEIKATLRQLKSVTIKAIGATIKKVQKFAEPQKKILLEIK